jgi:hypothetical protein
VLSQFPDSDRLHAQQGSTICATLLGFGALRSAVRAIRLVLAITRCLGQPLDTPIRDALPLSRGRRERPRSFNLNNTILHTSRQCVRTEPSQGYRMHSRLDPRGSKRECILWQQCADARRWNGCPACEPANVGHLGVIRNRSSRPFLRERLKLNVGGVA